jgi:hypothetical protein
MTLTTGDGHTLLAECVADQAALHGLLQQRRDIGLPVVSVCRVEADVEARPPHHRHHARTAAVGRRA